MRAVDTSAVQEFRGGILSHCWRLRPTLPITSPQTLHSTLFLFAAASSKPHLLAMVTRLAEAKTCDKSTKCVMVI